METNRSNRFLIKSKKQMFTVIAVFTLILFVGGTTYAFFNYTRTGPANTLNTGRIYFSTEQTNQNTITLNNIFPMTKEQALADSSTNGQLVVTFNGDTEYTDGMEYLLSIDSVTGTTNVPISLLMDVNITENSVAVPENSNYYTAREAKNTSMYLASGTDTTINSTTHKVITDIETGKYLLAGYIKSGQYGITGSITIKAFIDADNILITDTPDDQSQRPSTAYTDGTVTTGKTVISTTDWNSLQSGGISFKVKGEAREGIWIASPGAATMSLSSASGSAFVGRTTLVSITTDGDGTLSCESSDTTKATCSVNQNTKELLIYGVSNGTATIIVNQATGSKYLTPSTTTYNVIVEALTLYGLMSSSSQGPIASFAQTSEEDGTSGVYETVEGTTTIYYYRGAVNNNVKFGDYCWKAVRTTVTGGVKLIYNGEAVENQCITQTGSSTMINAGARFNNLYKDAKYVGYTYDDNGIETDSNMKQVIDTWYSSAITNNKIDDSKVETTSYCNDRSVASTNGSSIYYGAYDRLNTNRTPSLNCPNASDNYSMKAGFITADEIAFAGGKYGSVNKTYYLCNNKMYWSGSPDIFAYGEAYEINEQGGKLSSFGVRYATRGVRSVVSLVPGIAITGGEGTPTSPYIVS